MNDELTSKGANLKDAKRQEAASFRGVAAASASAMAIVVFAILPVLALAAAPSRSAAAQGNPRFASMQIDIWPEYDRQAALVILKGELPADIALPAAVSLRIPASSGGPSAVAFSSSADTGLFNLAYDRTDGDGFITLRFSTPQRFIHVEFYDPLVTDKPERSYTYVWPGDLAVEQLRARLQEPAAASDLSVQPDLGAGIEGPDGLLYRTAELGMREAGKQLPIEVRYLKRNSRTSVEILGRSAPAANPPAPPHSGQGVPAWVAGLAAAIGLSVAAIVGVLSWRRREKAVGLPPGGAGFCPQCGNRLASGDRFCSNCGAPVRKR